MEFTPSAAAREAMRRLTQAGFDAVYVGGCVRDACLGLAAHDFDLASSAHPAEVLALFADCRTVKTGIRHGTVTVLFDGEPVEITTYRADGAYADGRRPEQVRFSRSLEEDLRRRDFTVNALCVDAAGNLIDRFGGLADLAARRIRAIGDPDERFSEDALRVLRALRFAARLGFSVESETAAALLRHREALRALSAERVRAELFLLLEGADAARVLAAHAAVFFAVLPQLDTPDFARQCALLPALAQEAPLRLACLLLSCGDAAAQRALSSLALSKRTRRRIAAAVRAAREPIPAREEDRLRLLGRCGEAVCADAAALRLAADPRDGAALALRELIARRPCCTVAQLAVTGGDLMEAGVPFGPAVGRTLEALLGEVIAGRAPNERAALLAAARGMAGENGGGPSA